MPAYTIALFFHFLSLALAIVGASLATYAALRLRLAATLDEVRTWGAFTAKVVRVFPIATLGLLVTGGYLAHALSAWSEPWVLTSLFSLIAINILGAGVEGGRGRALRRELEASGLSPRARQLLRDPLAWSAKGMTLTLLVAVMFIMTGKPDFSGCIAIVATAMVLGVLGAIPFWKSAASEASVEATAAG
jgi:hypothetical protein